MNLAKKPELKYVDSGVEDAIANFGKTVGVSPRNISEMLRVIEIRLSAGRNKFYLQLIFNPWSYNSKPPIVEIINVNCPNIESSFFSIELINSDEGRHRIALIDHDEWSVEDWQKSQDPEKFWAVIIDVLEVLKDNGLTYKNLNVKSGAWDLFFPIGVRQHFERLTEKEQQNNWKLLTEKESKVLKQKEQLEIETKKKELKAKLELMKFSIEKSENLEELEANTADFDKKLIAQHPEINVLIEQKRDKLQPSLAPINFDDPAFTKDTAFGKKGKTKIRRI